MIASPMNGIFQQTPKVVLFLATNEKAGRDKFQGILRYMRLHTPWNIHLIENGVGEQQLVNMRAWGVTGIIVARMPESIRLVEPIDVPTVVMDSPALYTTLFPNASFVTSDSETVGKRGAELFLKQEFRSFAYVPDAYEWDWSTLRGQAFQERLAQAGLECRMYGRLSPRERKDWTLDQKRLTRWLLALPKPTAVLAVHDARARQVLETCQLAGLGVPGDIALLGVDNDELLCENTSPTLSSIHPDYEAGGYEAAGLLEQLMRGVLRKPQRRFYGIKGIVVRESSRFAHAIDRRYLRGLEFVRLNVNAAISVPDVARYMGVSRRLAEVLFHTYVGHSILSEIQQVRLARLKAFLLDTALPIGQISLQCGYQSEAHAKRIFKQQTGLTMSQFRKKIRSSATVEGTRKGQKESVPRAVRT
jgi:LacI family transcriptional regulator